MAVKRKISFGTEAKVKKPGGAPPTIINNKIEVRPVNRTTQDVPKWRNAIKSFEGLISHRSLLYDLYKDVELDTHVTAVVGKRVDPIKAANWQFVDYDGQPVDEINDVIDSLGFDDLLEEIIKSKLWGYSILEPVFWQDQDGGHEMHTELIKRKHYRPELGIVAEREMGDEGINIREGVYARTIMEVGDAEDMGLYAKVALWAILKRGGSGDWAAFIQTFGQPFLDAMWDGFDDEQRLLLQRALRDVGAGAQIIRPSGTELNIIENNTSGTSTAHNGFLDFCNNEISKGIIGTTETTESSKGSSGYAQSKTHLQQDQTKSQNDMAFVRKVLNSRFIRILQSAGFNTMRGRFIIQGEDEKLTKAESFKIHSELVAKHNLPVDDDFWYETYDLPKPENYDQLKKEMDAKKEEIPESNVKPPKSASAKKIEDEKEDTKLFDRFKSFFVSAPQLQAGVRGAGAIHTITLSDEDNYYRELWDRGEAGFSASRFIASAQRLNDGFKSGWDKRRDVQLADGIGFEYGVDDPALLASYEQNLFRFSGAKTLAEAARLNQLFRESSSFEEFYQKARAVVETYRQHYAETEYVSARLAGESAATYQRLIKQTDTFPYWKYVTAGDDLVRREHAALEGMILRWDDSRWDKLFPPNGWNCRCYIVPVMAYEVDAVQLAKDQARADTYINSPKFEQVKRSGWGSNRGKTGAVFAENQMYLKGTATATNRELLQLGAADFNRPTAKAMYDAATAQLPEQEPVKGFYEGLESLDNEKILRDYNNRPLLVPAQVLGSGTAALQALLHSLLDSDEVWLGGNAMMQYTYLKMYQNRGIAAIVELVNGKLQLRQWKSLGDAGAVEKVRKGLLIKS